MDLITLPYGSVYANPDQPRKEFDPEKLQELAASIKEYGILEPIVVTPRGERYMIVAGERRFRASALAGLTELPARVIEADDALVEELALLENVQRQDLNAMEEARAYQSLLDRGWSKEELATKLGLTQTWRVDEKVGLLKLDDIYQKMLINGTLDTLQAQKMALMPEKQHVIFNAIKSGKLGDSKKLRAFIRGLREIEAQGAIFEFMVVTEEERAALKDCETVLHRVEQFVTAYQDGTGTLLRKAVFHSDITPQRIDLIIQGLLKIRHAILTGEGVKNAIEAA